MIQWVVHVHRPYKKFRRPARTRRIFIRRLATANLVGWPFRQARLGHFAGEIGHFQSFRQAKKSFAGAVLNPAKKHSSPATNLARARVWTNNQLKPKNNDQMAAVSIECFVFKKVLVYPSELRTKSWMQKSLIF